MGAITKKIFKSLLSHGFDASIFLKVLKHKANGWFYRDFKKLKKQKGADTTFIFGQAYPILTEKYDEGGIMKGHYFHQDLYVARLIYDANPQKHLDIGSRTDGFVAHVASYRTIEFMDIRDITASVKNIIFKKADLMKLSPDMIDYCDSISSLHAIEHFGLGRYGDPIDYWGYLKAINNISKILRTNGCFYFSVPIGPQRIEFNAHRVFSLEYLRNILSPIFEIKSFSFVDDAGNFFENVKLTDENVKSNLNCQYGCGIFTLIKK